MPSRLNSSLIFSRTGQVLGPICAMYLCAQSRQRLHMSCMCGRRAGAPGHHCNAQLRFVCNTAAAAAVAGDFVDLGLDDFSGEHINTTAPAGEERAWCDQPTLGVRRDVEVHDGQEYSRLNIPLTHPRARQGDRRHGSRSVVLPNGELCVPENGNNNNNGSDDCAGNMVEKCVSGTDESAHYKPSLPYDDERFAEMLLQMEVEGAIDEAWQDARKAHMEDVVELVDVLRSLKVRDVCAIDVSEKTSNFDYMIVGTCEGPRHIHLAAWAVQEADSLKRICKIKRKQTDHTWEVVPVGRIVVNLMQESLREEMTLERKWTVTKCMDPLAVANAPVSEGRQVRAHGLWTLTLNFQDLEDFEVDYCKDVLMQQL